MSSYPVKMFMPFAAFFERKTFDQYDVCPSLDVMVEKTSGRTWTKITEETGGILYGFRPELVDK